jgi:DNA-binding MarR family transcriptional regulator
MFVDALLESPAAQRTLELLKRSPSTFWTASAAATALDMGVDAATEALDALERAGLLERARAIDAFRYAPSGR